MQLKTILNRVAYFKSFVYGKAKWVEEAEQPSHHQKSVEEKIRA